MSESAESLDDDLKRSMDSWQLECTIALVADYGHSWGTASALAAFSRHLIESGLREPRPLVVLTTI